MALDGLMMSLQALGGVGLFLLGIVVMTDGLRSLAGDAVRSALMRFTKSPTSGALTGAITTAILQSSSATTVAAIGFVGAGLIGFSESLGIIFGANIGTTVTGWIVALLGFKLKMGDFMLPFVLVGVLVRLFAKGRVAAFGYALAGFALIFVSITMMQQGMSGFEGAITPESFPPDTLTGRLKLFALGVAFTLLTQSSSAGVATALTALYGGVISLEQSAALVVGMDVGTTVTAAMATIGGSVGVRRTGLSHVVYNIFTGIGALFLITPYVMVWESFAPDQLMNDAEIVLVAFHTSFNLLGVIIVLPFTHRFARMIVRLIPDKRLRYTDRLDEQLLKDPDIALTAVQESLLNMMSALFAHLSTMLGDTTQGSPTRLSQLQQDLDETQSYLDKIHLPDGSGARWERLVAMIHTLDHLQRLHERCDEEEARAATIRNSVKFAEERDVLITSIKEISDALKTGSWHQGTRLALMTKNMLYKRLRPYRTVIMAEIARGEIGVPTGTDYLEGVRWLKRVTWHITRITRHFEEALLAAGK